VFTWAAAIGVLIVGGAALFAARWLSKPIPREDEHAVERFV
jgi:HAMP domain-containing protein